MKRFNLHFLAVITFAIFGFASNASAYWQMVYDLTGTQQQITNTPLMAGDALVDLGPGELVINFIGAPDFLTPVSPGDSVQLVSFELLQDFSLVSVSTIHTQNVTELGRPVGGITDTTWGGGVLYGDGTLVQAGSIGTSGSATGTWDGTQVNWSGPATNWSGFGATTCAGNAGFCSLGGWPDGSGDVPRVDDSLQDLTLTAFVFEDPMTIGSSFSAAPILTYSGADATTYLHLSGTLSHIVIPEPSTALLLGTGLLGLAARRRSN